MQRFGGIRNGYGSLGAWAIAIFLFVVGTPALPAQTRPLDLDLPPSATHYPTTVAAVQPGAYYYGEHSDTFSRDFAADAAPASKAAIGGSISTGFYGGSRHVGSGMWNEADLDVGKPINSGGMLDFSLGLGQAQRFGGDHHGY